MTLIEFAKAASHERLHCERDVLSKRSHGISGRAQMLEKEATIVSSSQQQQQQQQTRVVALSMGFQEVLQTDGRKVSNPEGATNEKQTEDREREGQEEKERKKGNEGQTTTSE